MIDVSVSIRGDRETIAWLRRIPTAAQAAVRDKTKSLALRLQDRIKSDKLAGQVLHSRSGRLRDSIRVEMAEEGARFTATISANTPYAAAHEYGFHGMVNVRAHLRRTVKGNLAMVRPFQRDQNVPQASFMRSTLDEMTGEIKQGMREAVFGALKP